MDVDDLRAQHKAEAVNAISRVVRPTVSVIREGGDSRLAQVIRDAAERNGSGAHDPWSSIPTIPPNRGQFVVPHVLTMQGLSTSLARVYRPSDEAMRHAMENARYMLNDPGIVECLFARMRPTVLLKRHIEPEDKHDPEQTKTAEDLD